MTEFKKRGETKVLAKTTQRSTGVTIFGELSQFPIDRMSVWQEMQTIDVIDVRGDKNLINSTSLEIMVADTFHRSWRFVALPIKHQSLPSQTFSGNNIKC